MIDTSKYPPLLLCSRTDPQSCPPTAPFIGSGPNVSPILGHRRRSAASPSGVAAAQTELHQQLGAPLVQTSRMQRIIRERESARTGGRSLGGVLVGLAVGGSTTANYEESVLVFRTWFSSSGERASWTMASHHLLGLGRLTMMAADRYLRPGECINLVSEPLKEHVRRREDLIGDVLLGRRPPPHHAGPVTRTAEVVRRPPAQTPVSLFSSSSRFSQAPAP